MSTLLEEFKSITGALNDAGIEYAVCGGWAMAIHGIPRATIDIDLLILGADLGRVWELVKQLGYDVEGLPRHFGAIEIRRISKIDPESKRLCTLDLLLVTPDIEKVWQDRQIVDWEEGTTSVVSKAGLVTLKEISGRDQDLVDIKKLTESENHD
jgi:hypothetical protein